MIESEAEITRRALSLPPEAKVRLAEELLDSIAPAESAELDAGWSEEIERRLRAYDAGEVQSIPAPEVFAELLSRRPPNQ